MNALALPQLGKPFEGGSYAAILSDKQGRPYILVLLDDRPGSIPWAKAMEMGGELGADLPNRVESAHLFACLGDRFEKDLHWTNEQYSPGYAWFQDFDDGGQSNGGKKAELAARFVSRLPLESFNPFKGPAQLATAGTAQIRAAIADLIAACDAAEAATSKIDEVTA